MLDNEELENKEVTPPIRIILNNITNTRKTYARFLRAYNKGQLSLEKAKTLTYMFSTLISMFKTEYELKLDDRLKAIEKVIKTDVYN